MNTLHQRQEYVKHSECKCHSDKLVHGVTCDSLYVTDLVTVRFSRKTLTGCAISSDNIRDVLKPEWTIQVFTVIFRLQSEENCQWMNRLSIPSFQDIFIHLASGHFQWKLLWKTTKWLMTILVSSLYWPLWPPFRWLIFTLIRDSTGRIWCMHPFEMKMSHIASITEFLLQYKHRFVLYPQLFPSSSLEAWWSEGYSGRNSWYWCW